MAELNYNHLRYFRAIALEGGLTRAAARLNLSGSAMSAQLATLEAQLGHRLFDREGRRLVLTEAGRIALDYAETVFAAGDELVSTLKGRPTSTRQTLRVGALTTLSRNFQIAFLRPLAFRPDVEVIVRSGSLRDLLTRLESHGLDLVLANSPAPTDSRLELRSHLLSEQPVSLVGRPRSGRPAFRFPEDLEGEQLLLPSEGGEIRAAFDRALDAGAVRPRVRAEVDDMAMLRLLARDFEGLALVPPIVVRDELRSGVLVEHCRVPGVIERFHAILPKRRFPNPLPAELIAAFSLGEED